MAYAWDDGPVHMWREGMPFPPKVLSHVRADKPVRAWNAAFEFNIWNNCLMDQIGLNPGAFMAGNRLQISQLMDTMIQAAYWGLPLSLDAAAPAAGLNVVKDKAGHALMLRMCRPRTWDKATGDKTWWHIDDTARFVALMDYCRQDVVVERAIANAIPPLPASEQALWQLDQKMNNKGIYVDRDLIHQLEALASEAVKAANVQMAYVTGDRLTSANSVQAMLPLVQAEGYPHDDLTKGNVAARLADLDCWGLERRVLEIRADVAKTSAAKLKSMLAASDSNGLVRGMLQFYGAFRTGRWAGRLIQMQNLPRGTIKNVPAAVAMIRAGATHDQIEALFGSVMGVVSSCLRACIWSGHEREIVSVDFSQIEARVLAWLAGQQDILDVFASGKDVYVQEAAGIYGVEPADVTGGQRQIGKVAVLALGYAGGVGAFQTMAANYGVQIEDQAADDIKVAWRTKNHKIVDFWHELDRAVRNAITNPAEQFAVTGGLRVGMYGAHLIVKRPSGRHLTYRNAELRSDPDRPGNTNVTYMGQDQYTRKWTRLRSYGGKFAENITQAVARDLMAHAMTEADHAGHDLRLTIHDELIAYADKGDGQQTCDQINAIMREIPKWARGLPQDADGWAGVRYKK
jgi:DNA polymerase